MVASMAALVGTQDGDALDAYQVRPGACYVSVHVSHGRRAVVNEANLDSQQC